MWRPELLSSLLLWPVDPAEQQWAPLQLRLRSFLPTAAELGLVITRTGFNSET